MATRDWAAKTSDVPEGARRQWRADRALRPPMRSPGRPEPSRAAQRQFWRLIATGITSLKENIQTIVQASQSQHMGLAEINVAIGAIDHGTQQNATMVEESTVAAEQMRDQAARLAEVVGRFNLREDGHAQTRPALPQS